MLFESTKLLLRSIVRSLESGDETGWDAHQESCNQLLYELHQMSRSSTNTYRKELNSNFHPVVPSFDRAVRAIPRVKLLNIAVRQKNRAAAIENGKAAMSEMDGTSTSRTSASNAIPTPERNGSENPTIEARRLVQRHNNPEPQRSSVVKRKGVRVSKATSL